jgi:hypothetical protein
MRSAFKKHLAHLLIFLFIVSVIPHFMPSPDGNTGEAPTESERYDKKLSIFKSISSLEYYVDSLNEASSVKDTSAYVLLCSETVKDRFYFGLAEYSLKDNWIAFAAGKLFWSHFRAIVKPDDILDHTNGLCSQQTIVFLELLKRKNIKFRSVGLGHREGPGHFVCEVYYQGDWHLFDVTKEPDWEKTSSPHASMGYYLNHKDSLYKVYKDLIPYELFAKFTEKIEYGAENEFPAKNMALFHDITLALTYFLPVIIFYLLVRTWTKKKVRSSPVNERSRRIEEPVITE